MIFIFFVVLSYSLSPSTTLYDMQNITSSLLKKEFDWSKNSFLPEAFFQKKAKRWIVSEKKRNQETWCQNVEKEMILLFSSLQNKNLSDNVRRKMRVVLDTFRDVHQSSLFLEFSLKKECDGEMMSSIDSDLYCIYLMSDLKSQRQVKKEVLNWIFNLNVWSSPDLQSFVYRQSRNCEILLGVLPQECRKNLMIMTSELISFHLFYRYALPYFQQKTLDVQDLFQKNLSIFRYFYLISEKSDSYKEDYSEAIVRENRIYRILTDHSSRIEDDFSFSLMGRYLTEEECLDWLKWMLLVSHWVQSKILTDHSSFSLLYPFEENLLSRCQSMRTKLFSHYLHIAFYQRSSIADSFLKCSHGLKPLKAFLLEAFQELNSNRRLRKALTNIYDQLIELQSLDEDPSFFSVYLNCIDQCLSQLLIEDNNGVKKIFHKWDSKQSLLLKEHRDSFIKNVDYQEKWMYVEDSLDASRWASISAENTLERRKQARKKRSFSFDLLNTDTCYSGLPLGDIECYDDLVLDNKKNPVMACFKVSKLEDDKKDSVNESFIGGPILGSEGCDFGPLLELAEFQVLSCDQNDHADGLEKVESFVNDSLLIHSSSPSVWDVQTNSRYQSLEQDVNFLSWSSGVSFLDNHPVGKFGRTLYKYQLKNSSLLTHNYDFRVDRFKKQFDGLSSELDCFEFYRELYGSTSVLLMNSIYIYSQNRTLNSFQKKAQSFLELFYNDSSIRELFLNLKNIYRHKKSLEKDLSFLEEIKEDSFFEIFMMIECHLSEESLKESICRLIPFYDGFYMKRLLSVVLKSRKTKKLLSTFQLKMLSNVCGILDNLIVNGNLAFDVRSIRYLSQMWFPFFFSDSFSCSVHKLTTFVVQSRFYSEPSMWIKLFDICGTYQNIVYLRESIDAFLNSEKKVDLENKISYFVYSLFENFLKNIDFSLENPYSSSDELLLCSESQLRQEELVHKFISKNFCQLDHPFEAMQFVIRLSDWFYGIKDDPICFRILFVVISRYLKIYASTPLQQYIRLNLESVLLGRSVDYGKTCFSDIDYLFKLSHTHPLTIKVFLFSFISMCDDKVKTLFIQYLIMNNINFESDFYQYLFRMKDIQEKETLSYLSSDILYERSLDLWFFCEDILFKDSIDKMCDRQSLIVFLEKLLNTVGLVGVDNVRFFLDFQLNYLEQHNQKKGVDLFHYQTVIYENIVNLCHSIQLFLLSKIEHHPYSDEAMFLVENTLSIHFDIVHFLSDSFCDLGLLDKVWNLFFKIKELSLEKDLFLSDSSAVCIDIQSQVIELARQLLQEDVFKEKSSLQLYLDELSCIYEQEVELNNNLCYLILFFDVLSQFKFIDLESVSRMILSEISVQSSYLCVIQEKISLVSEILSLSSYDESVQVLDKIVSHMETLNDDLNFSFIDFIIQDLTFENGQRELSFYSSLVYQILRGTISYSNFLLYLKSTLGILRHISCFYSEDFFCSEEQLFFNFYQTIMDDFFKKSFCKTPYFVVIENLLELISRHSLEFEMSSLIFYMNQFIRLFKNKIPPSKNYQYFEKPDNLSKFSLMKKAPVESLSLSFEKNVFFQKMCFFLIERSRTNSLKFDFLVDVFKGKNLMENIDLLRQYLKKMDRKSFYPSKNYLNDCVFFEIHLEKVLNFLNLFKNHLEKEIDPCIQKVFLLIDEGSENSVGYIQVLFDSFNQISSLSNGYKYFLFFLIDSLKDREGLNEITQDFVRLVEKLYKEKWYSKKGYDRILSFFIQFQKSLLCDQDFVHPLLYDFLSELVQNLENKKTEEISSLLFLKDLIVEFPFKCDCFTLYQESIEDLEKIICLHRLVKDILVHYEQRSIVVNQKTLLSWMYFLSRLIYFEDFFSHFFLYKIQDRNEFSLTNLFYLDSFKDEMENKVYPWVQKAIEIIQQTPRDHVQYVQILYDAFHVFSLPSYKYFLNFLIQSVKNRNFYLSDEDQIFYLHFLEHFYSDESYLSHDLDRFLKYFVRFQKNSLQDSRAFQIFIYDILLDFIKDLENGDLFRGQYFLRLIQRFFVEFPFEFKDCVLYEQFIVDLKKICYLSSFIDETICFDEDQLKDKREVILAWMFFLSRTMNFGDFFFQFILYQTPPQFLENRLKKMIFQLQKKDDKFGDFSEEIQSSIAFLKRKLSCRLSSSWSFKKRDEEPSKNRSWSSVPIIFSSVNYSLVCHSA